MPLWHKDDSEWKATEKKQIREKLSALLLFAQNQDVNLHKVSFPPSLAGRTEVNHQRVNPISLEMAPEEPT